ncbi:MAG: hypothetical protein GVY10_03260 [Verrucomicrobia bacterium]|jgi:hypothetical protein|nr:hypothetical protein [Verrucomicrobiota bacterium]
MTRRPFSFFAGIPLLVLAGCVQVKTEPIKVEPIYIEITVNHRVQEELDSYFREIDRMSETSRYEPLDKAAAKPES